MPAYQVNTEQKQIEIYFENVPSSGIRRELKNNGWRWNPDGLYWWHTDSDYARSFAQKLCPDNYKATFVQNTGSGFATMFQSGFCGFGVKWMLSPNGKLYIFGFGEIEGYSYEERENSPWFKFKDKIREIKIDGFVSGIGKRAFYGFENLISVELSDYITVIGERAFAYCSNLCCVKMPLNLVSIETQAFRDCTAIEEIHIPVATTDIAKDVFKNWLPSQTIYMMHMNEETGKMQEKKYHVKKENTSATYEVYFEDFVAVTNVNWCENQGHEIENIQAIVTVLRSDGSTREIAVPAGFCSSCKKYFIGQWQYDKIRAYGAPLCQIIHKHPDYSNVGYGFFTSLSPESILKQSGYTVSAEDGLSDYQRQQILVCLVESGLCSKHKISSHLTWLIQSRKGRMELQNAVCKWRSDRDYIDAYKMGTGRVVAIRSLKVRK